jgi:rubrerythrin
MKEILGWLITIEDRAKRCYEKAAEFFCEDKELSRFLTRLAKTEEQHREIIRDIAGRLKDKTQIPFFIALDDETKKR